MAFLGKEYKFESQENFEEYIKASEIPEPIATQYIGYKPTIKLVKAGEQYTLSALWPQLNREVSFTPGVEFDDVTDKSKSKTTFNLEGNTLTKIQKLDNGNVLTTIKEFSGDSMVETYKNDKWAGTARRFYKA